MLLSMMKKQTHTRDAKQIHFFFYLLKDKLPSIAEGVTSSCGIDRYFTKSLSKVQVLQYILIFFLFLNSRKKTKNKTKGNNDLRGT